MLANLKPVSEAAHNAAANKHGTRVEHNERIEDGVSLLTVKTYADTSHSWWTNFGDGNEILVDVIEEIQRGLWLSYGGNFHSEIDASQNLRLIEQFPNITSTGDVVSDMEAYKHFSELVGTYIVCDNEEQALQYWSGAVNNTDHQYIISLMPERKKDQPEDGGWRWCKWGEYIGTQNPTCEYLYDEPDIDVVYCAHIYLVEDKSID